MRHNKIMSKMFLGFLIASLLGTSFGGAVANAAEVTTPEAQANVEKSSDNGVLGGVLAVGVLAALTHKKSGSKSSGSSKQVNPATTSGSQSTSSSGSTSSGTTSSGTTSSGNTASDEATALSLLNADRAANGLPALKANSSLTNLAGNYAQDMINRNYFAHTNPEGQSPFDRMKAAGITYKTAGENLAINTGVKAAEVAFMNSSGHRANILNSSYTEVGIGVRYNSKGQAYVVQEFIGK